MHYHTFELSYELTSFEYQQIGEIFFKSKSKTYDEKFRNSQSLVCEALREHGIIMKIVRSTANEFTHYCLYYRINPRRVMDENNYIGLFDAVDTDVMLNRVNRLIQGIHKLLPITDDCKINRIDFCVNVRMAGQKEISEYISLLQRVCCPAKYALETFYDSKSKRKKPKKNSCNIIKENMLKLVFYNKYDQLRENKHCKNIDEAKNILRIEIQCFKKKVRHLSDKFGYTHVRTFLKHSDSVGDYVFRKYIKKCYGGGDFYKINEIRKIIDQSNCHKESKALMRELAETSAKHKSIDKAMRKLDYDKKTRKKAMKLFDKIGICPIVIPVRNKHDTFKNPLTLVMQSDNIQK